MKTVLSIFIALHGLVHIWFVVLSQNLVPFEKEMGWTGQSWLLSNLLQDSSLKLLSTIFFAISTLMFLIGGILLGFKMELANNILTYASIISSLTLIIFWDGSFDMIVQKGIIGLIINIVLLYLVFKYNLFI